MELSNRQLVDRFRWIMTGTMLLDIIVTLISQPDSYWRDRTSAFESNSLFHFFLVQAFPWNFIFPLLYMLASFAIVSFLPPKAALVAVFFFYHLSLFPGFLLVGLSLAIRNGGTIFLWAFTGRTDPDFFSYRLRPLSCQNCEKASLDDARCIDLRYDQYHFGATRLILARSCNSQRGVPAITFFHYAGHAGLSPVQSCLVHLLFFPGHLLVGEGSAGCGYQHYPHLLFWGINLDK